MEALLVSLIMTGSLLLSFGLIWGIKSFYKKAYEKSKHKFSDAEIFKLMAQANHFLTDQQLAAVSPLELPEAKRRLMHLSLEGVIRRFHDGGVNSVYQLTEELPESDILPISIQGLTEQQIVEAVLEYSSDYQITIAGLVIVFGIDVYEAKLVLKRLHKSGVITRLWKGLSTVYVAKAPLKQSSPKLKIPLLKKNMPEIKTVNTVGKIKIPDADVLRLAVEHQGKLTPAMLCMKMQIPINDAQKKLDDLYEQGAFIIDVGADNSVVEYHLRDKNLLG